MSKNTDRTIVGVIIGLLSPPIAFILFCYFSLQEESVLEAFSRYNRLHVIPHVISLACIVNLATFFLFIKLNKDNSARGVLGATFLFVILVLILKFT